MDVYEFRELVFSKFRKRLESGQNIESATSFDKRDFPEIPKSVIKEFCDIGYADNYYYNFALSKSAVEEALDEC